MNKAAAKVMGRFLIIGTGNMGSSLARGLHRAMPKIPMFGVDQHSVKVEALQQEIPAIVTFDTIENAAAAFWKKGFKRKSGETDVVILCIKPQDLDSVGDRLAKHLPSSDVLVMTLLAGVTMEEVSSCLRFKGPVVRAMPNIAAMVGAAATGMAANNLTSDADRAMAEQVFSAVGAAAWVKEELMDAVTGLSGSGPAFIYIVIEALTDGGVKMGLPRDVAASLATQTVLGSAMLVQSTGLHPAVLRDQVTTPGGTTISGIHELESHGIRAMMMNAVAIATERSHTLRKVRAQKKAAGTGV
jgi:pyrroline-5-carboxylate reductase